MISDNYVNLGTFLGNLSSNDSGHDMVRLRAPFPMSKIIIGYQLISTYI